MVTIAAEAEPPASGAAETQLAAVRCKGKHLVVSCCSRLLLAGFGDHAPRRAAGPGVRGSRVSVN